MVNQLSDNKDSIGKLKEQLKHEKKKRAYFEQAFKESEKNFADTQRVAKLGSWYWNVLTDEVRWSDELFRLLDYDPAGVLSSRKAFLDRVQPDDLPGLENCIKTLLNDRKPFSIDHRIILPDDSIRYVNSKGRLEKDNAHKPVLYYGTLQDISKRKRTELDLRIKESAMNSSLNGIGMTDEEGRMIYVNKNLVKMWGFDSQDEILGRSIQDFWDGDTIRNTVKALMEHGYHMGEDIGKRKDGSMFPVEFTASMIRDESSKPMAMFGSFIDISKRKNAELEIKKKEQFLKTILSSIQEHLCVLDRKGDILMVNDAWLNFANDNDAKSLDSISIGSNYLQTCSISAIEGDPYSQNAYNGIMAVISGDKPDFHMEYPCSSPTEERWFTMTVVPLLRDTGGAVIAHRNITSVKHTEAEAKSLRSELDHIDRINTLNMLSASIAHEINQPLAAILTNAQASLRFLKSDQPKIDEVKNALSDIVRDDKRAGDVIRQIRGLVKQEDSSVKPFQLNFLIRNVIKILQSELIFHNISVKTDLDDRITELSGNPVHMQQVLLNLLTNSIDALKDCKKNGRTIKISSKAHDDDKILIEITDSGPGIKDKELANIFKMFYTTKIKGMGLGLSTSQNIIKSMKGVLKAENSPEGGARFTIWLPDTKNGGNNNE